MEGINTSRLKPPRVNYDSFIDIVPSPLQQDLPCEEIREDMAFDICPSKIKQTSVHQWWQYSGGQKSSWGKTKNEKILNEVKMTYDYLIEGDREIFESGK